MQNRHSANFSQEDLSDLIFWEGKKSNILMIEAYVARSANIYSFLLYNTGVMKSVLLNQNASVHFFSTFIDF